ncbi:immediate early response gene 2 protein [Rhinatrema bivittatum]|uniref:immediate early response gene 2 protein n=1 Tax=Rhinatrema bivittatum TaxID=194408 RepID=UPI00112A1732|nr:immediate early response gene 2 protein [Rhinatrema bivittatum]
MERQREQQQEEAQRIMTLSVCKLYQWRVQRGGLRLHRSLQLSQVMRSARDLYLAAGSPPTEPARPSRKRRGCSLGAGGNELVPSKRARLGESQAGAEAQPQDGPFPSLARVLQSRTRCLPPRGGLPPLLPTAVAF